MQAKTVQPRQMHTAPTGSSIGAVALGTNETLVPAEPLGGNSGGAAGTNGGESAVESSQCYGEQTTDENCMTNQMWESVEPLGGNSGGAVGTNDGSVDVATGVCDALAPAEP